MSATQSISQRAGEVIFTISSICEEGLTTAGQITNLNLTYCAYTWLSGKLFDGCSFLDDASLFSPDRCQVDDQTLQTAMISKLACMSLLAVAITAKCVSSAFVHKKIS